MMCFESQKAPGNLSLYARIQVFLPRKADLSRIFHISQRTGLTP